MDEDSVIGREDIKVTPDMDSGIKNITHKTNTIDLTETESAGKAELKKSLKSSFNAEAAMNDEYLETLAQLKPMAILKKLGTWHSHIHVEMAVDEDLEE
eukprot:15336503-Ditylum_brightwellii.AAC.1